MVSVMSLLMPHLACREPHPRRTDAVPDLIIVPLLGFDAHGNRIGYGAAIMIVH